MLEFNKISTESNFIKNLLATTYLPLIRTVREGDYIVVGRLYILRCNIIKCTKSGIITNSYANFESTKDIANYRVIEEYHFGERNGKLCTNYVSNCEGYDSITHEKLGNYLRGLRDMYALNLMPLYNCFSNVVAPNFHIHKNRVGVDGFDYETLVYKVPIRFNTTYTICMENLGVTSFAPAFIEHGKLLKINNSIFGNGVDVTKTYIDAHMSDCIISRAGLRFKKPITIRFNNIPETKNVEIIKYITEGEITTEVSQTIIYDITEDNCRLFDVVEDKLFLLIQVPKAYKSGIVILEGEYAEPCEERLHAEPLLEVLSDVVMDYLFTDNLKLMESHTDAILPISPTLLQFLLWNAICNLDTINNDMDRLYIQLENVYETSALFKGQYANYWTPEYRDYINYFAKNTRKKYITDNLGYVTKDIEEAIGNGDYY